MMKYVLNVKRHALWFEKYYLFTGVGGRLDATNVFNMETLAAVVITSISKDHTAILGNSIEEISREKAGILKQGVPVVIGPQPRFPEVTKYMTASANHLSCKPIVVVTQSAAAQLDQHSNSDTNTISCSSFTPRTFSHYLSNFNRVLQFQLPHLLGDFQLGNAATALETWQVVYRKLMEAGGTTNTMIDKDELFSSLSSAMSSVTWPGRLQRILDPILNTHILLDGAHNPDSVIELRKFVDSAVGRHGESTTYTTVWWVFGCSCGKQYKEMLDTLLVQHLEHQVYRIEQLFTPVTFSQPKDMPWIKAESPEALTSAVKSIDSPDIRIMLQEHSVCEGSETQDILSALKFISNQVRSDCLVVVCGSLYLAADYHRLVLKK